MSTSDPLLTLILRNPGLFTGTRLLVAGDLPSERVLELCDLSSALTIICDDVPTAARIAAVLGQKLGTAPEADLKTSAVRLVLADVSRLPPDLGSHDALLLFLPKAKARARRLLATLREHLSAKASIYIAGENAGGGKSAGSLLEAAGPVRKLDLARKCTLFGTELEHPENLSFSEPEPITIAEYGLTLHQQAGIFSEGRLDEGTALLMAALPEKLSGPALDLGCGCGVIGLLLARRGISALYCQDISAAALELTRRNHEQAGLTLPCQLIAASDLNWAGKFSLITLNPPFHEGLSTSTATAHALMAQAASHLLPGGTFHVVGNRFLHHGEFLREHFATVDEVGGNRRFEVLSCRKD